MPVLGGSADDIQKQFERFDADGSGTIQRSELRDLLAHLADFDEDDLDNLLAAVDKNKDGVIQYSEFVDWITGGAGAGSGSPSPPPHSSQKKGFHLRPVPKGSDHWGQLCLMLRVTDPMSLGVGRDVREKESYGDLVPVAAWSVHSKSRKALYEASLEQVSEDCSIASSFVTVPRIKTKLDAAGKLMGVLTEKLDGSINEKYLLHGTKPEVLFAILRNGLSEKFSGGLFGAGLYFAEDPSKADQYTTVDPRLGVKKLAPLHKRLYTDLDVEHPGNVHYVVVCRVAIGVPVMTKDGKTATVSENSLFVDESKRQLCEIPGSDDMPIHYHTLLAEKGPPSKGYLLTRHREFVSFDSNRVLESFIVAYQRVKKTGRAAPTTPTASEELEREEARVEEERKKAGKQSDEVATEFQFTDTDGDVMKIKLEGGLVNSYLNGELHGEGVAYFEINEETRSYRDPSGGGQFQPDEDLTNLTRIRDEMFRRAIATEFQFTDTDGDVIKIKLEGGLVNSYLNGELDCGGIAYFEIDERARTYWDPSGSGEFQSDVSDEDLANLKRIRDKMFLCAKSRPSEELFFKSMIWDSLGDCSVDEAFRLLDDDGTGRVSFQNLIRFIVENHEYADECMIQRVVDFYDSDGDGELNEDEFGRAVESVDAFAYWEDDDEGEEFFDESYEGSIGSAYTESSEEYM